MAESAATSEQSVLTINGGSSSIRFARFAPGNPVRRRLSGEVARIGQPDAALVVTEADGRHHDVGASGMGDRQGAVAEIIRWLDAQVGRGGVAAVGHRIVHGGPRHVEPWLVTPALLDDLRGLVAFAPNHLPAEIALIDAFERHYPGLPQIVCFDTAFHHDLPTVAKMLPIPRRYAARGVRRYGFHGLSYAFLLEELARVAGPEAAAGRVILAHLGNGASLAAVRGGKCIDTSMGFTPTGGLMMGTRSGDLDPGVLIYLVREDRLGADALEDLLSKQSGLLGISETSSDMRDLLGREITDPRAAEAVAMFCYQAAKWIGAFAAALGGLDTVVFAGGIGEHAPPIRARICEGLGFLGVQIDESRNSTNAPVISREGTRPEVRMIRTDEESMIAKAVYRILGG